MKRQHQRPMARNGFLSLLLLLALVAPSALARQDQQWRIDRQVSRAQESVRERIRNERGRDASVTFNNDAQRFPVSGTQVGVRGTGVLFPEGRSRRQEFTYSAVLNNRNDNVERVEYRLEERGGGGRREVPRWLVGTFRGRNPSGRQRMLVTVEENGRVSVVHGNGTREYGTYDERQLRIGSSSVWNVSRNDDGFRAQDDSTRRTEDFVRVEAGRGDDDTDDSDGRVPRWAVGTFRGTTDTGESELTINRDGSATITSVAKRTMFSGRYADGVLTFDWGSFNVTRDPEGIRTVQVNNRRNQTTYRRVN